MLLFAALQSFAQETQETQEPKEAQDIQTAQAAKEAPLRTDLYRINDYAGILKKADINELDALVMRAVNVFEFDLPVCIKQSYDQSLAPYADWFYTHNRLGYGSNKNGLLLFIGTDTDQIFLKGYGAGEKIFTPEVKQQLIEQMRELRSQNYTWLAPLYVYTNSIVKILKQNREILDEYADGKTVEPLPKQHYMPSWYPDDIKTFVEFHDERASRVIDDAHIFSKEEIATMKEHIKRVQDDYGIDLLVFTDKSSHALAHDAYAAEFYDVNGYGFGDDFTGTVLFICMDENDRDWWTVMTGKCRQIYTPSVINMLDDNLEPFMLAGNYGEGVINYIDDVYELYKLPDWYPENPEEFVPFHAENKPHVVDQAGLFSKEEQTELARRADEISAAYGTDCLILTTDKTIRGGTLDDYIKDFIKYNGYGEGENNDTFVFCIKKNERFASWYRLYSTVSKEKRSCYTQKNFDHILEHASFDMEIESFYSAATTVLDYAEKMYLKGWVLPKINYLMPVIIGLILGFIIAKARTSINKSALSNIRKATSADDYYVDGSFHLGISEDNFLMTNTTRRKIVHETSSSYSSSSSGRSSYHSSYRSSTGRSHSSGGGRKF